MVCANPLLWRFFTYRAARLFGVGQRWLPASSAAMIGLFFRLTYQVLWPIIVLGVTTNSCPLCYDVGASVRDGSSLLSGCA